MTSGGLVWLDSYSRGGKPSALDRRSPANGLLADSNSIDSVQQLAPVLLQRKHSRKDRPRNEDWSDDDGNEPLA